MSEPAVVRNADDFTNLTAGDRVAFGPWGPGTVQWHQGDSVMTRWDRSGDLIAVPKSSPHLSRVEAR
ncbi:hypothetical protein [Nocardia sp. NPDC052566]|uniref:hypothetical protein n=1 Tax=Nocardia sp. NPDC052566 TaxID=3364330 RepID=UPI0037C6B509